MRKPLSIMIIAGEPSGDLIAAELVRALREDPRIRAMDFAPRFFGAGGSRMAAAGVELDFDMTRHAVVGLVEVIRKIASFRRLLRRLVDLAAERQPDLVVCVDFGGFNLRFARALRRRVGGGGGIFQNWRPRIVQYVSPQVWASRPGRAGAMARTLDLLLCILPFEKDWYARRTPALRVEFVGHPLLDRHQPTEGPSADFIKSAPESVPVGAEASANSGTTIALLPGSRTGELRRHLPVMLEAAKRISAAHPTTFILVLPDENLLHLARQLGLDETAGVKPQIGGLAEALSTATMAIACTGTVMLECAFYGVPTVALYKTSPATYAIARRVVTVKYLAMPNLLANAPVFPEFIQGAATPENLSRATLELLADPARRLAVKSKLAEIVASLGGPGAGRRAAAAIASWW